MNWAAAIELLFWLAGGFVVAVGLHIAVFARHARRWGSATFWVLLGVILIGGKRLPAEAVGWAVIVMTLLAAAKQVDPPAFPADAELANRGAAFLKSKLLWPVLLVPAVAITGNLSGMQSQVALGLGCVLALVLALVLTRDRPTRAIGEGGRLLQLVGWALILPQMLAALGGIFAKAGVDAEIAKIFSAALPVQLPYVAVVVYCAGMAIFTIVMGNAFAAFPVMTLGVGLPFIVNAHGGNPAIMGALGMLSGYCGTLVTPMAANFNLVPVRLLELRDDYAVIKAQAPFAIAIWIFNVVVMCACVYRF